MIARTAGQVSRLVGAVAFVASFAAFIYESSNSGLHPLLGETGDLIASAIGAIAIGLFALLGSYLGLRTVSGREFTYGMGLYICVTYLAVCSLLAAIPLSVTLNTGDGAAIARGLLFIALGATVVPYLIAVAVTRIHLAGMGHGA
jgi:hypothetical protein